MKTVKKHAAKKRAAAEKYVCGACGAVIEVDPCGCSCAPVVPVCCGTAMKKKRS